MLNAFGQWLRKFRIDKGLLLKDMAATLGVSSAFLSAIETGRKNIPDGIVDKICDCYDFDDSLRFSIEDAVNKSKQKLTLDFSDMTSDSKELAFAFAKSFQALDQKDREQILTILSRAGDGSV
ncbi:MAG: helix-turn-helix transcriptional regulator [Synergistaceae bacterium]|nr:helix-turn-helix transcriptional regulator [Synergistaceae bacterium]